MPHFNRLLITGAAGNLGRVLRKGLAPLSTTLRLTDRGAMDPVSEHEEAMPCELGNFDAVMQVVEDCDAIVHFGAAPLERPWAEVLDSSIVGGYNIYEAARQHGVKRIVYASSIHAVGYERRENGGDTNIAHNPDTLYGVSKCFVEDLAKLYWNKWGIESACIRINSCYEKPRDRRHLATWLSFDDLVRLVERCLVSERIAHTVVYGISNNQEVFFSNHRVAHLGYRPKDNAEDYREEVEAKISAGDPADPAVEYAGGFLCAYGHPDESERLEP
ncbi:MAG: NAD(P)-dependent oxidoreductase [Gammaproteobacteria bacterium]|nr:NAD(P)-dependent oxidoreductase [Gammaproteobacteria bacterium]